MGLWSSLFGELTAPRPSAVMAGAATVALAPGSRARASLSSWPIGTGPQLAGVEGAILAPPWFDRDAAMSNAAVSRCRDLICSSVAGLPFTAWHLDLSSVPAIERRIPAWSWFGRPDPDRTRQWMLAWTTDDLFFYGRAHWEITSRYADSFPRTFRRLPPGSLTEQSGTWTVTEDDGRRRPVAPVDVIEFLAPDDGLLDKAWRVLSIAWQLDAAADRFAGTELPAGVLQERDVGQEELSPDELTELAARFSAARLQNTIAAVNRYLEYVPVDVDASKQQLVEARTFQALEVSRICDVPPYLVGAPAGTGMTYLNGQQARQDLIDFGAQTYITCIEQTLSGPNVIPSGNAVRLDLNAFLRNPFTLEPESGSPNDLQVQDPTSEPASAPTEVPQ